jgi:YebC/PmpR family DNA-binding regulatory protein
LKKNGCNKKGNGMAGHSKWANIKHRKERADQKKGKIFSRIVKELISAVKQGGTDPKTNAKLRLVIQKAKAAGMPSDNVTRNIQKASSQESADYQSVTYEIYGHGGVGIIVEAMTDNKNRTASEMRIATNKCGGNIATPGSVAFNFDHKGTLVIPKTAADEDDLFLLVSELGAEEFEGNEESFVVITDPKDLYAIKETLDDKEIPSEAELVYLPKTSVSCEDDTVQSNEKLIEWLENVDDVDAVYHNML